jgi:hypothetical protein
LVGPNGVMRAWGFQLALYAATHRLEQLSTAT